jgi:hypothetical protein
MSQSQSQGPMGQGPGTPPPPGYATSRMAGVPLKKIATQQRAIMFCILGEFLLGIALMMFARTNPLLAMACALAYWAVVITAVVFIFMLSITLYNTATGVILGILVLIPLLGLIILLVVNGKATKTLRQHGIKVGLMGADPATIPPDGTA